MTRWIYRSVLLAAILPRAALIANGADATVLRDVPYGQAGNVRLLLDVHVPRGKGPFPIALMIHGGGWSHGDKAGSDKPGDGADISPWFAIAERAGLEAFSINYRMAPQYRWPACAEDVDTAIRWVKAHAQRYNGDASRIVLFGHSSGGHLVCYAATHADADTRVQAVAAFAPVTDLVADSERRGGLSSSLQGLFDVPREMTDATKARLVAASPINAVQPGLPPIVILHGTADKTVPFAMSEAFAAKLRAAGDTCDIIPIPGAPHRLLDWNKFDPGYQAALIRWLGAHGLASSASP